MEGELRSIRQEAQNQERTIQDLTDSVSTKDNEVCVLCVKVVCATALKPDNMMANNVLARHMLYPLGIYVYMPKYMYVSIYVCE